MYRVCYTKYDSYIFCDYYCGCCRAWLRHGPVNSNGYTLDDQILSDPEITEAIDQHKTVEKSCHITNTDRSSFARISGVIAAKYGDKGFTGKLKFHLTGGAGQSFGAFLGQGMEVKLVGYGNDYVGKGMAGGKLVLTPPAAANLVSAVVGNTVLYGATGAEECFECGTLVAQL